MKDSFLLKIIIVYVFFIISKFTFAEIPVLKSLLPDLNLTTEEEGDIKNMEERLRLYELFTRLGENI